MIKRSCTVFARYVEVLRGRVIWTVDREKGKVRNIIIVTDGGGVIS